MDVACTDTTSAARLKLFKHLEKCFKACLKDSGHLILHKPYPISKQELLLNSPPDLIVLGPEQSIEEAWSNVREFADNFPRVPIISFLKEDSLSLSTLKRFEKHCHTVLTFADSPARVLHHLEVVKQQKTPVKDQGKLLYVDGAKGGIGTTSLVTGLAHSAADSELSAVLVDLSLHSSLSHYLGLSKTSSSEMTALVQGNLKPSQTMLEKSIQVSQNGLELLLPPSLESDIREIWLRSPKMFEHSLEILELLKQNYDLVIVDGSQAEGILPFSIISRAELVLSITSADPASIHLLDQALNRIQNIPGPFSSQVLVNNCQSETILPTEIEDLLNIKDRFEELIFHKIAIPYDTSAQRWIGSGNSFYTEAHASTKSALKQTLQAILKSVPSLNTRLEEKNASLLARIIAGLKRNRKSLQSDPALISYQRKAPLGINSETTTRKDKISPSEIFSPQNKHIHIPTQHPAPVKTTHSINCLDRKQMYAPPQAVEN